MPTVPHAPRARTRAPQPTAEPSPPGATRPEPPPGDSTPYNARDEHEIRRQILDAAHGLLIKRGYARFSLREVARVLGKSSGSPYRHCATKQELVGTMLEEALGQVYAAVRTAAERAGDDPAARFEALCRAYVAYGLTHPKHYEVAFLLDSGGLPAMPLERLSGGRLALDYLAGVIEAGGRAGVLRGEVAGERPIVTAGVIWAALHGAVSIAIGHRILPGQGLTADEVVDATLKTLVARYVVAPDDDRR